MDMQEEDREKKKGKSIAEEENEGSGRGRGRTLRQVLDPTEAGPSEPPADAAPASGDTNLDIFYLPEKEDSDDGSRLQVLAAAAAFCNSRALSELDEPGFMDPKLWEQLQYRVDWQILEKIFLKLPLREFFQLRLVCREWNRLAGDRTSLETSNPKPIQKPYFHLCRRGRAYQVHGLLTYTSWSKEWNFTCLGHHGELDSLVALEGLIFSCKADDRSVRRVFNIHSRVWYTLPPLESEVASYYQPVVAMKVDTSTHPYKFQVFQGAGDEHTQTYDSQTNTWRVSDLSNINDRVSKATCAQVSDAVYNRADNDEVHCYKIKEDYWYSFDNPPGIDDNFLCGIGAWKEKVYHLNPNLIGEDLIEDFFVEHPGIQIEFIMYVEEDRKLEWEEFDRMPHDLRDWLVDSDAGPDFVGWLEILTSYCDAAVLIYSYWPELGKVNRFVFYNLETKLWEKADIPAGIVQPFRRRN